MAVLLEIVLRPLSNERPFNGFSYPGTKLFERAMRSGRRKMGNNLWLRCKLMKAKRTRTNRYFRLPDICDAKEAAHLLKIHKVEDQRDKEGQDADHHATLGRKKRKVVN